LPFILALYGPAINSAAFKKMAARCSQAMLAHALLDSNAFAMAFRYAVFSKMISTYDMFMVVWCGHGSSISSSNFFADIKRYINFRIPHFSISCLNGCFSGEFGAYPLLVRLPLLVLEKSFSMIL
jgi:hypothetical protein